MLHLASVLVARASNKALRLTRLIAAAPITGRDLAGKPLPLASAADAIAPLLPLAGCSLSGPNTVSIDAGDP